MDQISYMQTIHPSVYQIKVPKVAIATKSTDNNIKKLKVFLSNEKQSRSNNK